MIKYYLAALLRAIADRLSQERKKPINETIEVTMTSPHPTGHPSWPADKYPSALQDILAERIGLALLAAGKIRFTTYPPASRLERAKLSASVLIPINQQAAQNNGKINL